MQNIGYVEVNGEKVLVLWRREKYGKALKRRLSGKEGMLLIGESDHLSEAPATLDKLKAGEVIHL